MTKKTRTFRIQRAETWKTEYEIQAESLPEAIEMVVWKGQGTKTKDSEFYAVNDDLSAEFNDLARAEGLKYGSPEYKEMWADMKKRLLLNRDEPHEVLGVFEVTEVKEKPCPDGT